MKCHCGKTLRKVRGTERLCECKCGCVYRLCIVRKSGECAEKQREQEKKSLKLILAERKKRRKR